MAISDKSLTCVECGSEFTFTVGEQEFFASRGYTNEPKRCQKGGRSTLASVSQYRESEYDEGRHKFRLPDCRRYPF